MIQYIQVKSDINTAKVIRVDGREKVAFGLGEGDNTMYLSPDRAKALAFRLLEAANHAVKQ